MLKKLAKFLLKAVLWFVALSVCWVLVYKYIPVVYTPLMFIRWTEGDENYKKQHRWVPIEEISSSMQLAVICSEDQQFLNHNGFDYSSIKKAYTDNKKGKRLKGGSTISQQVAKNTFLWPKRNWLRKGLETWFTFLIETFWSKERILEVYLNSIEMGPGVYGTSAAADYWFNTSAKELNAHEAAAIAAILPNPRKYKASPRTNYLEKRKAWVLRQMHNFGTLKLTEE